jgi:hypothetical protein
MPDGVLARAKAALEGVTAGPWRWNEDGEDELVSDTERTQLLSGRGDYATVVLSGVWHNDDTAGVYVEDADGQFIVEARQLVPELVAEIERLQSAGKTLGKIIDDSLRDVLNATGSHDLIGEDGDGDWMAVFERLAELRPARDAALAEVERLQAKLAAYQGDAYVPTQTAGAPPAKRKPYCPVHNPVANDDPMNSGTRCYCPGKAASDG